MRKLWITLLLVSVSLFSVISPVYVEGNSSPAAKKTTTTSTLSETGSTVAELTDGFVLKVDPPSHKIQHLKNGKTRSATYSVQVKALSGFRGEVALAVQGVPPYSVPLLNPERGVPKPGFASVLKVFVPPSTPAGVYTLTIVAAGGGYTHIATTTLIVEGESSPPTTLPEQKRLQVTVSTDKENYQPSETVKISGYVKLDSGASIAGADVSLSVLNPEGENVHLAILTTSEVGSYSEDFALPSNAMEGTYTIYSAATLSGYQQTVATLTFTVGQSQAPSVRVVDLSVALLDGTLSSEFHPGETVVIWAAVNNTGADLVDGNTWVEVLDPDNSPITVVVVIITVNTGEQERIGVHIILGSVAKIGTYAVRVLVSDGPIVTGGKFLDSEETAFVVIPDETQTTTTITSETTSETTASQTTMTETSATETTATETSPTETTTI